MRRIPSEVGDVLFAIVAVLLIPAALLIITLAAVTR